MIIIYTWPGRLRHKFFCTTLYRSHIDLFDLSNWLGDPGYFTFGFDFLESHLLKSLLFILYHIHLFNKIWLCVILVLTCMWPSIVLGRLWPSVCVCCSTHVFILTPWCTHTQIHSFISKVLSLIDFITCSEFEKSYSVFFSNHLLIIGTCLLLLM